MDADRWRFVSTAGRARIVRDINNKQALWQEDLRHWFDEGPESDDIVLIKVTPTVVSYWTKTDQGEVTIK